MRLDLNSDTLDSLRHIPLPSHQISVESSTRDQTSSPLGSYHPIPIKERVLLLEEILDQGTSKERPGRGPQEGWTPSLGRPRPSARRKSTMHWEGREGLDRPVREGSRGRLEG